jgi:16S rRNA (adenine1518-N6/adenine1519-N6)-dimethyltransferase
MPTANDLLRKYEIHPKKRLGQCFLIDQNIIGKIVQSARIRPDETVVEIGAGIGVMTAMIAARARRVIALDLDPQMIHILREELKDCTNLEIVHTDVLKYDLRQALDPQSPADSRLKVVGNIPYNISTEILFQLIANRSIVSEAILMIQKEVGDRIAAGPGSKAYGIPSVLTAMFAEVTREIDVPASCFRPAPKVDSVVISIAFRPQPLVDLRDPDLFFKVVKAAFAMRRKTLLNNLKTAPALLPVGRTAESVLAQAGIDGGRRGETLTAEEFGRLSSNLADPIAY